MISFLLFLFVKTWEPITKSVAKVEQIVGSRIPGLKRISNSITDAELEAPVGLIQTGTNKIHKFKL